MYVNEFFVKKKISNPMTIASVEKKEWLAFLNLWWNLDKLIFFSNIINTKKEKHDKRKSVRGHSASSVELDN